MHLLDVRTVMISWVLSNAINAGVIFLLWRQNRLRFAGLDFWLADYLMQLAAVLLITLRGIVPDFASVILSNALIMGGTILLYMGLERFVGKRGPQWHNAGLLAVFLSIHTYFLYVVPNMAVRNISIALTLLLLCLQGIWLMLRRVDPEMRSITRGVALVFAGFCLASMIRVIADVAVPIGNDFFRSDVYDTLVVMTYQMLFILLSFNLVLMVNRRLFSDLEQGRRSRAQVEEALRTSEEKFSKAFLSSPDAIFITRAGNGDLLEVNEGFCRLSEYSREEALASSTIQLSIWADPRDRDRYVSDLRKNRSIRDSEYNFRSKSGKIMNCLCSGEMIYLGNEAHIVSIVHDITERKRAERELRRSEANFREVFDSTAQGIFIIDVLENGRFRIGNSNRAQEITSAIPRAEVKGKLLEDAFPPERAQLMRTHYQRVVETGAPLTFEEEVDLPAGHRFLHITLSPVQDESGRICRIIGSTLDISDRKQIEEILRLRVDLWEYSTNHPMDELMQKALDGIGKITSSPIGFYHFVDADQKALSLQAWSTRTIQEFCQAEGKGRHYSLDDAGVWADSIRERKPIIHNDYSSLPNRRGMPPGHAEVVRELVVPTIRAGRVVSVLGVGNKHNDYTQEDVELVAYIADIVWTVVERKRSEEEILRLQTKLQELAIHDALTGLYNRHYMNETLTRELARATREKYPISFLMIDIDHFKRVNDTFGHRAGDAVLQELAASLISQTRAGDLVYRYGGEEFLVVLPKVKPPIALQVAEKLRKSFVVSTTLLEYGGAKITISCGVSAFPAHGTTSGDLIASADKAMYQAKEAGRNRTVVWKKATPGKRLSDAKSVPPRNNKRRGK
jgi:diguanylate cyclase (GGDEF)-like protein/PAS domain S-box-containing protein